MLHVIIQISPSDSVNELNVSTNIVDADVLLNDDVIDDSESVDCNHDDECDDVGDANMLRGLETQMSTI